MRRGRVSLPKPAPTSADCVRLLHHSIAGMRRSESLRAEAGSMWHQPKPNEPRMGLDRATNPLRSASGGGAEWQRQLHELEPSAVLS